jgi:hypothetical protein
VRAFKHKDECTKKREERDSNGRCAHWKLKIKREGGKIESYSVQCVHPKLKREKRKRLQMGSLCPLQH